MAVEFDTGLGLTQSKEVTGLGGGTLLTECHSSCNMAVWAPQYRMMYLQRLALEERFHIHRPKEKRSINLNLRRDHTRWFLTSWLTWKRNKALHKHISVHPSIIWNSLFLSGSCEGGRSWSQLTLGNGGAQEGNFRCLNCCVKFLWSFTEEQ